MFPLTIPTAMSRKRLNKEKGEDGKNKHVFRPDKEHANAVTTGRTQGPEPLITNPKSLRAGAALHSQSRPLSVTGVAGVDGLQPILDRSRQAVTPRELNTERNKNSHTSSTWNTTGSGNDWDDRRWMSESE